MRTGLTSRSSSARGLGPGAKVADPAEQPATVEKEFQGDQAEPMIVTHKSVGSSEDYQSSPHFSDIGNQDWRNRNYPAELPAQATVSQADVASVQDY